MSTKTKYRLILGGCILLSLGGMLISVFWTHDPLDGSRGGVVAVGFTLAFIVLKSNLAVRMYLRIEQDRRLDPKLDGNIDEIGRINKTLFNLENFMKAAGGDDNTVNRYLVMATVISTAVAAFGDIACRYVMEMRGTLPPPTAAIIKLINLVPFVWH